MGTSFEVISDFFVVVPAAFYNIISLIKFFVFDYVLIGAPATTLEFTNPFDNKLYGFVFTSLDIGIIDNILSFFNVDLSITFFELLCGPVLFIVLLYAVIKYLIPV